MNKVKLNNYLLKEKRHVHNKTIGSSILPQRFDTEIFFLDNVGVIIIIKYLKTY